MSTLDEIRARNDNQMRMGHRFAPGSVIDDRRTLLALLDAQSLELSATKTSYGLLCDRLETAEKELQAVREALEGLFVACTTDSGAVLIGGAIAKARAALKQSRGAT